MSEELIQRNLVEAPEKMGDWNFYNIGATSLKALKGAKIIPDRDYEEYESKKPDALIVKKPLVIAAIEYKRPSELRTEKQIEKAIAQELGTAQALQAKIYIVTDGKKSFWINPATGKEIIQENGSKITFNFDKRSTDCITLINKIRSSISATNDQLKEAASVDPLPLAEKVWQDLWAVSGATPENCLYTFVEIFIFKYLSDLSVLKGMYSFYNLLGMYSGNNENEVLEYYASTVRVKIKELFPGNPKDKTTIINGTIFVSKDDKAVSGYATVFHKILKRFNEFGTLENIDYDFKSKLFETFLKESISKKNWGQYFTPLKVVRAIVNMVELTSGMEICDPACGVGKFLLEPILHELHKFYLVQGDELKPQITLYGYDKGFDKDEQKTIILAKANMLIYMSGMIREHPDMTQKFAQLFNDTFLLQTNSILGTLAKPIYDKFDLILTNPPYVMSGSSNLKEEIAKQDELKKYFSISAMGIEGLFMEWIVRALKPGGKAFVVVPDGIMNRSNDKKLRDFILEKCNIDAVISLPLNTFFTTNKKTYILALTKKITVNIGGVETLEKQTTPVFTYLCSEIGESRDVNRFDIPQNDLENASDLFNMFKGAKTKFKTTDKRCKIKDINDFYTGSHWSVDRWWTTTEKIELGIKDEESAITLDSFASMLGDVSNVLLECQDLISGLETIKKKMTQSINLTDETYFHFLQGEYLGKTKGELVRLPIGDIPVYTANKEPILFISKLSKNPIEASLEKPVISFANDGDGSAGRNFVFHTAPFYINASRTALIVNDPKIIPEYVLSQIFDMKEKYGFNYGFKANKNNLSVVTIEMPIDDQTGEFDIQMQNHIIHSVFEIQNVRNVLIEKRNAFESINVAIEDSSFIYRQYLLSELFVTEKGLSKYTKKYGNAHSGEYPVYSASSQKPLTFIDTFDFDGRYMTWSTNGFAGTILILDGKFSINGDRGILVPKDNRTDLDFDYIKCTLEPIFRELAKGRKGDNGEDEFTKLYPSMISDVMIPMPIDSNGDIDLSVQKQIAAKYLLIQQCQQEIVDKLNALIDQKLNI
ncbi:MAG: N-6 DNA methylase [Clostridia bacterium]|nr:N-6 DNA methylase [Clostridia bacterium]